MTEFKRKNVLTPRLKRWLIVLAIMLLFVATCAVTMLAPHVNCGFGCEQCVDISHDSMSLTDIDMGEWDVSLVNATDFMMYNTADRTEFYSGVRLITE